MSDPERHQPIMDQAISGIVVTVTIVCLAIIRTGGDAAVGRCSC